MSGFEFDDLPPVMGHNQGPELNEEFGDFDEEINFEEDSGVVVGENQLARVSDLSNEMTRVKAEIDSLETELERLKGRYDQLRYGELPEAMTAANMAEFKTLDGFKIESKPFVRASLTKDPAAREKAAAWLREHHRGAIIKRQVGVQLGVGNDEAASKAVALLKETMPDVAVTDTLDVHHSTLSSTIREMLENGEEVPLTGEEIGMNLHMGREAKISKSKR